MTTSQTRPALLHCGLYIIETPGHGNTELCLLSNKILCDDINYFLFVLYNPDDGQVTRAGQISEDEFLQISAIVGVTRAGLGC